MLRSVDLTPRLKKRDYKARLPCLQTRLFQLQQAIWNSKLACVVLFEGWDSAGVGSAIDKLTERLEPRGFQLHSTLPPRSWERPMPWLWRFWMKLPAYGEVAIFDRSWYSQLFSDRVEGSLRGPEAVRRCLDIVHLERTLTEDRYLIVKLFLHLSHEEKNKRLKKLKKDPLTRWRLGPQTHGSSKLYDRYRRLITKVLKRTNTHEAPWDLVSATDSRWAKVQVFETLIRRLEAALEERGIQVPVPEGLVGDKEPHA